MKGPYTIAGVRWWLAEGRDPDALRAHLARAADALRGGRLGNRKVGGRRKALFPLSLAGPPGSEAQGAPDHLLKVNHYTGAAAWRRRLLGSKARAELARAEGCMARGIATPMPSAAGEIVSGGRLERCLLLMPLLEGVTDLRHLVLDEGVTGAERRALGGAFGRFCRHVHDAGLFQEDFALNNVLVRRGATPDFWMIDFERARLRRRLPPRERLAMLTKLHRDWSLAPAGDRGRFLQAYAGDPVEANHWWRVVEAELPKLARRDFRHAASIARGGRRIRRVQEAGWRGYARLAPGEALASLLERARPPEDREGAPATVWTVAVPPQRGKAEALWSTLNFLNLRRGLAPLPLAFLVRPGQTLLLLHRSPGEREPGAAPTAAERRAHRVLLRRTGALGQLGGNGAGDRFLVRPGPWGAPEALWLRPASLQVCGRSTSRAALEARLSRLG